jgi:polyisoprenyl-phosphate glycosyltransferase
MAQKKSSPKHPLLSVVSPVYRAEAILETFVERVVTALTSITQNYEIILVEDGSPDGSWEKIKSISARNKRVRGIKLSRNFGQHVAINACLEFSRGDFVVLMDCDLQDDPSYIQKMYNLLDGTADYVITLRQTKNQSQIRKIAGGFFYKIYNWLANGNLDENIGGFSMLTRKVVDAYLKIGDYNRYYLLGLSWLGFSHKVLMVENQQRHLGTSSYTLARLLKVAFGSIISYSEKLLSLAIILGVVYMASSILGGLYIVIDILYFKGIYAGGWPSVFVLLLFSVGVILFCVGVAALYIGNIFTQVKGRPRYIVGEMINV